MSIKARDSALAKKWEAIGKYPQMTMILTFGLMIFFSSEENVIFANQFINKVITLLGIFGGLVFTICLYELYWRKSRFKNLITDGVFKYTRHPMYTGLFFMGIDVGAKLNPSNIIHILVFGIFLFTLLAAGYSQEKETLARFGKEAVDYYKKTPRLFFLYPFANS